MPENDQASRPPLLVRLFLLVAARSPLDLEQVREPRPPFVRYAVLWLGVLVCSLLAIPVGSTMTSDFGFVGPTMLQAANPVWSAIAMAILVILYTVLALVLAGISLRRPPLPREDVLRRLRGGQEAPAA